MSLTEELAHIALHPGYQPISDAALDAAKVQLLDACGCAMAGWSADGCQKILQLMCDWGGKPEATVLFYGDQIPSPHAAFINSVLIHALDYDDVYLPGLLHPSAVIIPAALATAQSCRSSGRELLEAIALGMEVAARIGMHENGHRRGDAFLPTSLVGGFGAVAAAARLMKLSLPQCVHAMGMNYAQASGNRQALVDATLTKRIQPAFAARSALWSTALAARGVTGPQYALEGKAGYYPTYTNIPRPPEPGSFLHAADQMQIERISYKHFPSCGISHSCQLATEDLRAEEALEPKDISKVEIFGIEAGGLVSRPFTIGHNPQVDAQFSAAWAVAHTLLRGHAGIADYQSDRVEEDQEVIQLAMSIPFIPVPGEWLESLSSDDRTQKWHGLIVTLQDGRKLIRARVAGSEMKAPNQSKEQIIAKFMECAAYSRICPEQQATDIVDSIMQFEQSTDLHDLLSALPQVEGNQRPSFIRTTTQNP